MARLNDPQRYNCQPVIGELAVRRAPCDHCRSASSDQQPLTSLDSGKFNVCTPA